jgi:hypothetical protein
MFKKINFQQKKRAILLRIIKFKILILTILILKVHKHYEGIINLELKEKNILSYEHFYL